MAQLSQRLPQNVEGDFFVDSTCIDCDACRQIAPRSFARSEESELSYVYAQPASEGEQTRALMALVACPTSSIGTLNDGNARNAAALFPEPVTNEIFYCGYTSEKSFGASSYLVRQPGGNVMVDSPRAASPLLRRIQELGGVRLMLLSHRDDVADHQKFHVRFGCERVLHKLEVGRGTAGVERQIAITEPEEIEPGWRAIPVPGHTRGSVAYHYREEYLFTGDHLWWSPTVNALHASRRVCWYDWDSQIASMERLLDYRFTWVLPGHGRRFQAESAGEMRGQLEALIRRMREA
jgi:glyoxylase-like metal-dependent hydrolase (beta-lactamase superfamily II)/ferredoxin